MGYCQLIRPLKDKPISSTAYKEGKCALAAVAKTNTEECSAEMCFLTPVKMTYIMTSE